MGCFRMDDGTVVDTRNASQCWQEERDHNGNNYISRATKDQWTHETLFRSRRGRYYIVTDSNWQGVLDRCEWISNRRAAAWLLLMEHELPEDLKQVAEEVSE